MPLAGTVLFELAPISYGRIIYEVTSVTLGSLLLDRLPKSKPFTPLFSCKPAARGLPATYDLTPINTGEPTGIPWRGGLRDLVDPAEGVGAVAVLDADELLAQPHRDRARFP